MCEGEDVSVCVCVCVWGGEMCVCVGGGDVCMCGGGGGGSQSKGDGRKGGGGGREEKKGVKATEGKYELREVHKETGLHVGRKRVHSLEIKYI